MDLMPRRILVTGGRDYANRDAVWAALSIVAREGNVVVQGGCPTGADRFAKDWCAQPDVRGHVSCEQVDPEWEAPCRETCAPDHRRMNQRTQRDYCPAAGNYRNGAMVSLLNPENDVAIVFPGGNGTRDCSERIDAAGVFKFTVTAE